MALEVRKCTPKTAAQIKAETLAELTEMGFVNLPKSDADKTAEAMFDQIDNCNELHDKVFGVLMDYYADNYEFHKDTYMEFMERWVFEKADEIHSTKQETEPMADTSTDRKAKADSVVINLQKRGMCPDGIAMATYKTASRLARADGQNLKGLDFSARENYYLSAVLQIGAEILGN